MPSVVGAKETPPAYLCTRHVDSPEQSWGGGELEMKAGKAKKDQGVIQVGASLVGI